MRKGLTNPNTIQAVKELKTEFAKELSISTSDSRAKIQDSESNPTVNRKIVENSRTNLIGFK